MSFAKLLFCSPHPFPDNLLNSRSFLHLCEYPILSPLPFSGTFDFKLIFLSEGFKNLSQGFWLTMSTAYPFCPCTLWLLEKSGLWNLQVWNSLDSSPSCYQLILCPNCPDTEAALSNKWMPQIAQWFHSHVIHKEDYMLPRGCSLPPPPNS